MVALATMSWIKKTGARTEPMVAKATMPVMGF
jgi:hypothetical protein